MQFLSPPEPMSVKRRRFAAPCNCAGVVFVWDRLIVAVVTVLAFFLALGST